MLKQAACPEPVTRSVTASRVALEAAPVRAEPAPVPETREPAARPKQTPKPLPRVPIPMEGWLLEFRRRVVPVLVFLAVFAFVCYLWLHRLAPYQPASLPQ